MVIRWQQESAETPFWRNLRTGQVGIKIRNVSVNFGRRPKVFVTQPRIDRQPRSQVEIILNKTCKILVALVFAKQPRCSDTLKKSALATLILRRTLPKKEIGKALNQQESRRGKWHVQDQLMQFGFSA